MDQNIQTQTPQPGKGLTDEQLQELKQKATISAKAFATKGTKTHKEASPPDQQAYDWWENTTSYEGSTWQVSYWDYENNSWQIQVTKVELEPDGHSVMTSYSLRADNADSFPGFQVYKERNDDRYHGAAPEDVVYLERVLEGLGNTSPTQS